MSFLVALLALGQRGDRRQCVNRFARSRDAKPQWLINYDRRGFGTPAPADFVRGAEAKIPNATLACVSQPPTLYSALGLLRVSDL